MRQIQLVGEAYKDESLTFSAQDTVNWLPEPDESGQGRSPWMLRSVPGLVNISDAIEVSSLTIVGGGGSGQVGVALSFSYEAFGGTSPYTYSLRAGELPPGVTLNASTGVLSGTPTFAGNYRYSIAATDADGLGSSVTGSIAVASVGGVIPPDPSKPFPIALFNGDFSSGGSGWRAFTPVIASPGWSIQTGAGRGGSSGFLRWQTTTGISNFDEDSYICEQVIPSAGLTVVGSGWARCTAITGATPLLYAQVAIQAEAFADAACTISYGSKFDMFLRFEEVLDWRPFSSSIAVSAGQFIRLRFWVNSTVPATIEFDDLTATGYGSLG